MSVKISLNKLVDAGIISETLKPAENLNNKPAFRNDARPASATDHALNGGLITPVTVDIQTTETIQIDVPPGANAVDVDRVKTFQTTDSGGNIIDWTINYT